jgi:tRNA 2-thiouridine synthesizing protein A
MEATQTLDAKGLNCPLPILKAKKALKGMNAGEVLEILSTDPGSVADFDAFCKTTGNELLSSDTSGDVYTYYIKKT